MRTTRLGATGLTISRLALGCMSYGDSSVEGGDLQDHRPQNFL
jgi:aryl-alcohol dehydrogenase-like predicted oxidoreductase